jgi:hypothetical protein
MANHKIGNVLQITKKGIYKYSNQRMFVVEVDEYAWLVPYTEKKKRDDEVRADFLLLFPH